MKKSTKFSLYNRLKSFTYAIQGLQHLVKNEHNARIHIILAIIAIVIAYILNVNYIEWALLFLVIGIVLTAELFNSAIEKIADIVNPEWNEKVKLLKDYSSAAVLIAAITSLIIGCIIFIPKLISLLF